jgi:hypothetical protein
MTQEGHTIPPLTDSTREARLFPEVLSQKHPISCGCQNGVQGRVWLYVCAAGHSINTLTRYSNKYRCNQMIQVPGLCGLKSVLTVKNFVTRYKSWNWTSDRTELQPQWSTNLQAVHRENISFLALWNDNRTLHRPLAPKLLTHPENHTL